MDLTSLSIQSRKVALEAFAVSDVTGLLARVYPAINSTFTGLLGKFASDDPYKGLTGKQQDFMRLLTNHPYMDIRPLRVYTPEGLNSHYAAYSKTLLASAQYASKVLQDSLNPYSTFLSKILTNTGDRIGTQLFDADYAAMQKRREGLTADMSKCFKPGSTKTESTLGDVVGRNADWADLFKDADSITSFITSVDRKVLNRKVEDCVALVNKLQEQIKAGTFGDVSPQVVKNLAEGAYQIASELEFFALVYYRVLVFNECLNSSIAYITKTLQAK